MSIRVALLAMMLFTASHLHSQWLPNPAPASGPIYYNSGSVGIGTSTPHAKVTIEGLGSSLGVGNGHSFLRLRDSSGGANYNTWDFLTRVTEDGFSIANVGDNAIRFHIDGEGRVGIGTVTPNAPIGFAPDVGPKVDLWTFAATTGSRHGLGFFNVPTTTSPIAVTALYANTGNAAAGVSLGKFNGTSFTPTLTTRINGYVGIGTVTPSSQLAVSSAAEFSVAVGQVSGAPNERQLVLGYDTAGNFASIGAVEQGIAWRPLVLQ